MEYHSNENISNIQKVTLSIGRTFYEKNERVKNDSFRKENGESRAQRDQGQRGQRWKRF